MVFAQKIMEIEKWSNYTKQIRCFLLQWNTMLYSDVDKLNQTFLVAPAITQPNEPHSVYVHKMKQKCTQLIGLNFKMKKSESLHATSCFFRIVSLNWDFVSVLNFRRKKINLQRYYIWHRFYVSFCSRYWAVIR